jgi:hypothetical protein
MDISSGLLHHHIIYTLTQTLNQNSLHLRHFLVTVLAELSLNYQLCCIQKESWEVYYESVLINIYEIHMYY